MIEPEQIAVPVRFENGRLATVEQDSPGHIAQCVETVLRYEPGDREAEPDFGRSDAAFRRGGPAADAIVAAVERWEPRARLVVGDVDLEQLAAGTGVLDIDIVGGSR